MKKQILFLLLLGLFSIGNAWGSTTFNTKTGSTPSWSGSSGTYSATVSGITVAFTKVGSNSNNGMSSSYATLKKNNTLDVSSSTSITSIEITFTEKDRGPYKNSDVSTGFPVNTGSLARKDGTSETVFVWSGNAKSVSFTNGIGQDMRVEKIVVTLLSGPIISAQPVGANYVMGTSATPLTVTASGTGTLFYQWFSNSSATTEGATSVKAKSSESGANSFTPTTTESGDTYYYCAVTDNNGTTNSSFAKIHVAAAAAPTISIESSKSSDITAGESITLTATVDGTPTPTLKWYSNTENNTSTGSEITGETSSVYTFEAIAGTKYYYAKATNSEETTTSNVITITATARTGCDLNQVVYSNGFDAFITDPAGLAHGTITAYYLSGTSTPTISSTNKSAGAEYTLNGNTFTLSSEDGNTTKVYDVTLTAVEPYSEDGVTFNGTESWVVSPYGFCAESGKEGYRIQRNYKSGDKTGEVDDTEWTRKKIGKTRIYFFLEANTSVTLTNGGTSRNVKVYKNGVEVDGFTATNALTNIPGESEPYLLAIVSDQTNGDGALKSISVTGSENTATSESITPAKTYTTYVPQHDLDFTSASSLTAYVATAATSSAVTLSSVDKVPAGTPIVIKASSTGSPIAVSLAASTDDVPTNMLKRGDGVTSIGGDSKYDYILVDGSFYRAESGTVAAGKAYLHLDSAPAAGAPSILRIEDEENNATNIQNIDDNVKVVKFVKNGQLLIKRDGVVYDTMGRVIR